MRSLPALTVLAAAAAFASTGASAADLSRAPVTWEDITYSVNEEGNLMCYGERENGNSCTSISRHRQKWSHYRYVPVLACGSEAAKHYGVTGYDTPGHWCTRAYAALFADWVDHTPLGDPYLLAETPEGDVMCYSTDGVTCANPKSVDLSRRTELRSADVNPVICGTQRQAATGRTGYESATSWCNSPKVVQRTSGLKIEANQAKSVNLPEFSAEDAVGIVVQANLPAGRSLHMQTPVQLQQPVEGIDQLWTGFKLGSADGKSYVTAGDETWPLAASRPNGKVSAAMRLTDTGIMCYFQKDGYGDPLQGRPLGTSRQVLHRENVPLARVAGNARGERPRLLLTAGSDGQVEVQEILVVKARARQKAARDNALSLCDTQSPVSGGNGNGYNPYGGGYNPYGGGYNPYGGGYNPYGGGYNPYGGGYIYGGYYFSGW